MVSLVLLGPPCIASNLRNKHAATLTIAFALGAVITSYVLCRGVPHKLTPETPVSISPRRLATLAPLGLVVVAVCWLGFFVSQQPLEQSVSLGSVPLGQPHVLLIVLETVRADHLSVYGYKRETTPNLRELAAHATLYTRAVSSGDMTLSTHASLFTGLYGASHGAHSGPNNHFGKPLANQYHTLAEVLSTHGYQTAAVVANIGYLAPKWGVAQGFSLYDHRSPVRFLRPPPAYSLRRTMQAILSRLSVGGERRPWFPRAEEINRQASSVLDSMGNDERPFFLFVNHMDAHWPYLPPAPFDTLYPGKDPSFDEKQYRAAVKQILTRERATSEAERNHLVSQYDGSIAYVDDQVGRLFARLKRNRFYDNCLIIVTSDHGEAFGDRHLVGHWVSVYQDQVHVPLIIKYPNTERSTVVDELVGSIDVLPTVLDQLGYEIAKDVEGQSLLRMDRGSPRVVMAESFPHFRKPAWQTRFQRTERAIFAAQYKLITSTEGKREMYDLFRDPNETSDLYWTEKATAHRLEPLFRQWPHEIPKRGDDAPVEIDPETLERLRSLGYVESEW